MLSVKLYSNPYIKTSVQEIKLRFEGHLVGIPMNVIIANEKEELDLSWAAPENRLQLAPGEEILTVVFRAFGSEYSKPKDTIRIAKEMHSKEIDDEIKQLLEKAYALCPY